MKVVMVGEMDSQTYSICPIQLQILSSNEFNLVDVGVEHMDSKQVGNC